MNQEMDKEIYPEDLGIFQCLTLTQPWATLVAIRAKGFETRSWATRYRGPIAIHSSKRFPADCRALLDTEPFASVLTAAGYRAESDLPLGMVIATTNLLDCLSTNVWTPPPDSDEFQFGDYSKNRYAWRFEDARRIKPFTAKGALSLWKLPHPITARDLIQTQ